jgi:beta-N-acetylhexosaminidase
VSTVEVIGAPATPLAAPRAQAAGGSARDARTAGRITVTGWARSAVSPTPVPDIGIVAVRPVTGVRFFDAGPVA